MTETIQQPANIGVNDLQAAVNFIDIAVSRGAVRGDELAVVATLRERFLNVVKEKASQNAAAASNAPMMPGMQPPMPPEFTEEGV